MALLTIQNATIGYPGHPVLRDVTLEILAGQSVAVLGPNGSGKTAFLKTVAGILAPLAGEVRVQPAATAATVQVGYVPQRATVSGLLPLTVREVVDMGTYGSLKPWQSSGNPQRQRVNWALDQVSIRELERKSYSTLSGGQQQRVLIARALATDPAILVMDEPLASLDQDSVRSIVGLFLKLRCDEGLAILWADHLVPALLEVVREVMMIEDARLIRTKVDGLLETEQRLLQAVRSEQP